MDLDQGIVPGNGKYHSRVLTDTADMVTSLTFLTGSEESVIFYYFTGQFPFQDVDYSAYYYLPTVWGKNVGLYGTDQAMLQPGTVVTRGELVYDLWIMADKPAPASVTTTFTDVSPADYYYTAVQWAFAQGITGGTSGTTFSPDRPCTRGQVMTFLWRSAGCPDAATQNSFVDVAPGDYFSAAVSWAVQRQITNGTSATTFSPNAPCTRAQVMTFLFHAS